MKAEPDELAPAEVDALRAEGLISDDEAFALKKCWYQYRPEQYIYDKFGWTPWNGDDDHPGQQQIIDAYVLALRQMHERDEYEHGLVSACDLQYWSPGETIRNWIRLEAGHTVGKTKLASGLVSHFFDCFVPSIIYTFAPTWPQIKSLLWKEIASDRKRAEDLPGRVLETCEIKTEDAAHFAQGRATNDAGGKGSERVHGQHGKFLMFVLDEAEGVAKFVFDAVKSMMSGGICIAILLANPKTRTSEFYKCRLLNHVISYRMSCIWHPNVVAGKEIVPGAVRRDYVRDMVEQHADLVDEHNEDDLTFDLPFDLQIGGTVYPSGTIWKPDPEFLFRVLGIAPLNISGNTLVPVGRYEAATKRAEPAYGDPRAARIGVDVARWGDDAGTVYLLHNGRVRRTHQIWQLDTIEYLQRIKKVALSLPDDVYSLHIRIDGGGGFGSGIIDLLRIDDELIKRFADFRVFEVHFNATRSEHGEYYDLATEMYAQAAETIKGICIDDAPETLQADLCERRYDWRNVAGVSVKILESKREFKKPNRLGRSPDDGDGFVLAVSPDFLFDTGNWSDALGGDEFDAGQSEYASEAVRVASNW